MEAWFTFEIHEQLSIGDRFVLLPRAANEIISSSKNANYESGETFLQ